MTVPHPSFFNILNTPLAIAIQRLSTVTSVVTVDKRCIAMASGVFKILKNEG